MRSCGYIGMAAAAIGAACRQIFHLSTYLLFIETSSISSISETEELPHPQPHPPLDTVGCIF